MTGLDKTPKRIREGESISPKIDKRSILGIATASSGKRQELDSELACPTPVSQIVLLCILYFFVSHSLNMTSDIDLFTAEILKATLRQTIIRNFSFFCIRDYVSLAP